MKRRRKLGKRLAAIPHLFGKIMVIWCVACGTLCSFYALRILARTGNDPTSLLGVILAFLGGELALMFARNALGNKKNEEEQQDGSYLE